MSSNLHLCVHLQCTLGITDNKEVVRCYAYVYENVYENAYQQQSMLTNVSANSC